MEISPEISIANFLYAMIASLKKEGTIIWIGALFDKPLHFIQPAHCRCIQ